MRHHGAPATVRLPDGHRVSYAIYGAPDGHPVLALHGAPACRLMFAFAHEHARRAGLKLIAPDRPGYADTTPDARPSLAERARWLIAFADEMQLDGFALLGISGGAPYAVAVAAALGSRVSGLALVSPMGPAADYAASPRGRLHPIPFLQRRFFLHLGQRQWLTRPGAGLLARIARRSTRSLMARSAYLAGAADAAILRKPDVVAGLAQMTAEAFRNGGHGGASDLFVYGQPWDVDYAAIAAPCILWQGTKDTIVPLAAARYLAEQLLGCRYVELPGAGHFWVVEHIPEVLNAMAAFWPDDAGKGSLSAESAT
jgi:pimeloyl-ACP methyl ester carboxylesterase